MNHLKISEICRIQNKICLIQNNKNFPNIKLGSRINLNN